MVSCFFTWLTECKRQPFFALIGYVSPFLTSVAIYSLSNGGVKANSVSSSKSALMLNQG